MTIDLPENELLEEMSDTVQIEIFAEAWADWHIKHHKITPSERKAFVEGYIEGAKHTINNIRP